MRLNPAEVAIIGDDIDADVGGGQRSGMKGMLVKTGKYRRDCADASAIKPDIVIYTVKDLPELLQCR